MIKRTLLTGLFYLAICFSFLYLLGCFVQWEIIPLPPINEWTGEERMGLLAWYFFASPSLTAPVWEHFNNKAKEIEQETVDGLILKNGGRL